MDERLQCVSVYALLLRVRVIGAPAHAKVRRNFEKMRGMCVRETARLMTRSDWSVAALTTTEYVMEEKIGKSREGVGWMKDGQEKFFGGVCCVCHTAPRAFCTLPEQSSEGKGETRERRWDVFA